MSKTSIINGLTKDDIVLLYKYVNIYEKHIKELTTNEKIDVQIKQLYVLTKPFIFKTCSQNEVGNLTKKTENEVYFVKSASNKSLSFLYHLRNSIAHCLIEKEGTRYKFADKNRSKELTMIGTIDCSILESIIKLFV